METVQWIISAGASFFEASQVSNDLCRLRTSLPRARLLIDRAEWGRFKKEELAALLSQLKDTTYDAEDLLREFHDQELRHKIEDADRSRAGQLLSSSLNLARNLIHGCKTRIRETQSKLDKVVAEIEGTLNLMGLNVEPVQLMPETSSVIGEQVLFGRDKELDWVIEMLGVTIGRDSELDQVIKLLGVPLARGGRSASVGAGNASRSRVKRLKGESSRAGAGPSVANETNCTKNVSVLAIVGIGGVGKTTLAQFIYNDPRVEAHFDLTMWVCVSDLFDIERITRQIMKCTSCKTSDTAESLNDLQKQLRKQLEKKKFLLVLDDVWSIPNQEWQRFSAPLMYGLEGSMILVTTRFLKIAELVAPPTGQHDQHVQLEGLPADTFWDFFRICAFGNRSAESYPRLEAIGQRIADRLCGSPLAAKTLGRLLNLELTEDHWTRIQNSELWQLPHEENEILPALQLSYLYLPRHLKRCFAFCSMFPKDYSFERDEIVGIWVSQGFVALAPGGSMRLEDTGSRYLDDLRSRFLFQADPKLPKRYVMHDLIHDMAQSVSVDECFLMQDLSHQRGMPHTVRHMSIEVDNEALTRMAGLHHLNKLHSIMFRTRLEVQISWFNQLSNILFLSLKGCKLAKLPESICELNSLRYLDISGSRVQELPEKFWRLYSLQVFDASRSGLQTIHADIKNLINLRRLALPLKASQKLPMISGLGNLSSLRNLKCFEVGDENGRRICELKHLNQLTGTLSIKYIANVRSRAEAAEARLVDKQYLEDLTLHWREQGCPNRMSVENEVLEALRPPSRIKRLKVQGFGGDNSASWLKPENLPTIRSLELSGCRFLRSLSIPFPSLELLVLHDLGIEALTTFADDMPAGLTGDEHASSSSSNGIARLPLTRLTTIHIIHCHKLTNLDQCLSPEYLPSIKSIELRGCPTTSSLPDFGGFSCLQDLKIHDCQSLVCPREMVLPPSLQRLSICDSSELEKSFPGCLENLGSLTLLHLFRCRNVESIPLSSIDTNKLQCLVLHCCSELSSIEGPHALSSIQHVDIVYCPKLTEIQQPFEKKGLKPEEEKEAHKFMYGRECCLKGRATISLLDF